MNREERRSKGIKVSEPTFTLRASDIKAIRMDAYNKAVDMAFAMMLAVPAMVIHDKYPQIMKKDCRVETFVNLCLETYQYYDEGYIDLKDFAKCLKEEAGINLEEMTSDLWIKQ